MIKKTLIGACVMLLSALGSLSVQAQDFPPAKKVMDRYVEATGGMAKYQAIKNAKAVGEMSVPTANVSGKVEMVFVVPDKFYFKVDLGGLGQQERGSNGKVVWENSTVQGARIIEGDEADQMLQEISMTSILNPEKYYKEMKTIGIEPVRGEDCYVLALTRKNGDVDKEYYSVKTGLKLKTVKPVNSPLGKIEVESYESDYEKSKNGLLTSRTAEQKVGPNSVFMKMSSVEFNVDVDTQFDLPTEVEALIDK